MTFSMRFKWALVWVGFVVVVPSCLAAFLHSLPENYYLFKANELAITSLDKMPAIHLPDGDRISIAGPHSARWWRRDPALKVSSDNRAIAEVVPNPSSQTTEVIAGFPGTALVRFQTGPFEGFTIRIIVSPKS